MTPDPTPAAEAPRVTLDDIKSRVEKVKDLAVSDTKEAVDKVVHDNATRTLMIMAGLVVLTASVAFFLGSRASRPAPPPSPPGC